jgi:glycosyltransferase involved in cell wall biosynthesis
MKILYILPGKYFRSKTGGCVSHTTGVVDSMLKMGHHVIFYSSDMIPDYDRKIGFRALKIREINIKILGRVYKDYFIYNQINKIIKEEKPEVTYIRWRHNLFWGFLFKKRKYRVVFECNTPSTMSLYKYGNRPGRLMELFTMYMDRQICRNSDLISAVSEGVKDFLENKIRCSCKRIIVNPNGVNTEIFSPYGDNKRKEYNISKDTTVIGYSGSFRPQHGVEILINAFKNMGYRDRKLLIIGTGDKDYEEKLKSLAGSDRRIIFSGEIPFNKMPAYLRTCDILVSPQKPFIGDDFHQSPVKLYEYMAVGRAITASALGQIKNIIIDGYNGMLFESGDIESLRNCLDVLSKDKKLRGRLSANARKEAENNYTWEDNVRRIFNALNIDF